MTAENELEILADQPEDISGRLISAENLQKFKGLPAQLVFNKEDHFRPIVMDGENFGGKPLQFKDEALDVDGFFEPSKLIVTDDDLDITIDVNTNKHFQIETSAYQVNLLFTEFDTTKTNLSKELTLYFKFITGSNSIIFPNNVFWRDEDVTVSAKFLENREGDMCAIKLFTLDSGSLWFARVLGFWSN